MKISIYAEDFKNITERAVTAAAKKSNNPVIESVLIETSGNKVTAKAYNLDYYAEITTDAVDVIEEGSIVIHRDNLKSLYNMKGRIILESESKSAVKAGIVKSAKKTSRFFVQDKAEDFPLPSIGETQHAFTIKQSELLATMTKIKPYLFKGDAKPILKGIHIVGTEGLGTFYGCTGFICIRQKIHGNFDTFKITISEVSKELKDVSETKSNKQDCDITVSYSDKFVVFEGMDFKFATRLMEGEYPNLENPFNTKFTGSFDVNASEICGLAKEYKDILIRKTTTSKIVMPMIFTNICGELSVMALSSRIQTMDNFETADNVSISKEYIQSFDPQYMEIVMKTFGKEDIHIDMWKPNIPWRINGNSDCSVLLVPMRTMPEDMERIHNFIKNVA